MQSTPIISTRAALLNERNREVAVVKILERILWAPAIAVAMGIAVVGVYEVWRYVHWVLSQP
jgi:hypothetical protein